MKSTAFVLAFINGYKTYASAILAAVSGLGMILTKDYEGVVSQIFQAFTLFFGSTSVVGLRHAMAKLEDSREVGLRHAVANNTTNGSTAENTN